MQVGNDLGLQAAFSAVFGQLANRLVPALRARGGIADDQHLPGGGIDRADSERPRVELLKLRSGTGWGHDRGSIGRALDELNRAWPVATRPPAGSTVGQAVQKLESDLVF